MTTPKPKKGRPSKYKPEFDVQAAKLCKLGATDAQLADFFEVNIDTISEWKNVYPSFSVSLKQSKADADAQVVKSLFKRANGFSAPAVKIFQRNTFKHKLKPLNVNQELAEDAKVEEETGYPSDALVVPYIEQYPPDTVACIFWLKNRDPANWREKIEQEITGKDGSPFSPILNINVKK